MFQEYQKKVVLNALDAAKLALYECDFTESEYYEVDEILTSLIQLADHIEFCDDEISASFASFASFLGKKRAELERLERTKYFEIISTNQSLFESFSRFFKS